MNINKNSINIEYIYNQKINRNITSNLQKINIYNVPFFLPLNSGLIFKHILGYRLIYRQKELNYDLLEHFLTLRECYSFIENKNINNNIVYIKIRGIVSQYGFYIPNEKGEILDTITGIRYNFINNRRISEWDLNYLRYKPQFKLL